MKNFCNRGASIDSYLMHSGPDALQLGKNSVNCLLNLLIAQRHIIGCIIISRN